MEIEAGDCPRGKHVGIHANLTLPLYVSVVVETLSQKNGG
jgi:hypothetical protein